MRHIYPVILYILTSLLLLGVAPLSAQAVSYTHLDVYKRQGLNHASLKRSATPSVR